MRTTRRFAIASIAAALSFPLASAAQGAGAECSRVKLTTSMGPITLALDRAKAPVSVDNFVKYVKSGHYNGTVFHRVIDGFMVQGGGFEQSFKQKPVRKPVANEAKAAVNAGLKNEVGTLAMARTSDPDSATAQFFINVNDNAFLNWGDPKGDGVGYTVFGKVVSGMDVVTKIAKTPTGSGGPFQRDVPRPVVVIEQASLVAAK
jgi:peptidyl-prolyl cis-trans isomerase A (cyclophilin A)/peptidyl-prolyl cis-trans isomerase B (cyclophilin B)